MPTDWEAHYQNGETPWDRGAPSPGLVDFLAGQPLRGRVLVPGCGLGHDVRAIAAAAPKEAEILGLDLAPSAIEAAHGYPVVGGERYEVGDFFALPPSLCGVFDWVWEHTCFCAIDPAFRARYVASAAEALAPGGHYLAVFFLDPGLAPGESGPPFGVTPTELDRLFSSGFDLLRRWTPSHTYPGREDREEMRLYRKW